MKGRKDLVASAAYLPEPAAVAAARKFVRDTLCSWLDTAPGAEADGGLVDDAVLLTSELVTNAVVHAGTQVQVTCKLAAGAVEVVVRDSHPARMVPGPAPDDTVPAERTGGPAALDNTDRKRFADQLDRFLARLKPGSPTKALGDDGLHGDDELRGDDK